jgi:hypothetical protein
MELLSKSSMINHHFDPIEGILYVQSEGKINPNEMIGGLKRLKSEKGLPRDLKILEDASKGRADFGTGDMLLLMNKLDDHFQNFDSVRHAVIHQDPLSTALAELAAQKNTILKYRIRVFSSVTMAKKWLMTGE